MRNSCPTTDKKLLSRQRGLSLVELMIACAIGLLVVLAMTYVLVNSLQSRAELAKTSRQIENGRFAVEEMRREVQLAGFYSSFVPSNTVTWTMPDPCTTTLADLQFNAVIGKENVPVGLQGYTESQLAPSCVSNRQPGTDILVVRRVATNHIEIDADGDNARDSSIDTNEDGVADQPISFLNNAFYMQASNCSDLRQEPSFVVSNDPAQLNLHKVIPGGSPPNCTRGILSEVRRFITNIFYISSCNNCAGSGDGIPTLKMVEVSPNPVLRPIAEGIQDMQIEFGTDSNGDAVPDNYSAAALNNASWPDVMAVRMFLLARNADPTTGHTDAKTYVMGSDGSSVGPFGDRYRRQAYSATILANNIAGRRMQ